MKNRLFRMLAAAFALIVIAFPVFAESNENTIVYKTLSGKCYHTSTCGYLHKSKIKITLSDAVSDGLRPCSRCHPPKLIKQETKTGSMEKARSKPEHNNETFQLVEPQNSNEDGLTESYIGLAIFASFLIISLFKTKG